MQDILGLLFRYIQLLQQTGVCQWIFDEVWIILTCTPHSNLLLLIHLLLLLKLSAICETKFHYQDKIPPMSYIVDIASNMQVIVFKLFCPYEVVYCDWSLVIYILKAQTKVHGYHITLFTSSSVSFAIMLQIFPTKDWLVGSSLPSKFNPATVQKVVDELSPSDVR